MITVDQATGVRGTDPLATLATFRARANRVLSSLTVSASVPTREVREDGFIRFVDAEVGVSGRYRIDGTGRES